MTPPPTLGLDFGTSNTAAGVLSDGAPRLIPLGGTGTTVPTAVFFDFDQRCTRFGEDANRALLDGEDGRFMRALKRVLGTPLMHEPRQLLNERLTFIDIIARFLAWVKAQAEAATGMVFDRVLSGRPVYFHGAGDAREAQAEADLRACYLAAGFQDVAFMPEPEAAALASVGSTQKSAIGLVLDIGGGTSDFTLFQTGANGINILANHGVRLGGTDFDRAISLAEVMPLLGKGTMLRREFGAGERPVPNAIFDELATWEKIPFAYARKNRRLVAEMSPLAIEAKKFQRLETVLDDMLGHDIAFAVERGKIAANTEGGVARINLAVIEAGFGAEVSAHDLREHLAPVTETLEAAVTETLRLAGLDGGQITEVIHVGGSSLMDVVSAPIRSRFPKAQHSVENVMTAVADGLAIGASR